MNLKEIIKEFNLGSLSDEKLFDVKIETSSLNRPGIELIGFLKYHDTTRIQMFGNKEHNFISEHMENGKLVDFFKKGMPAIIYCQGNTPSKFFIDNAKKYQIPVLTTDKETTAISARLNRKLVLELSPEITLHGVFLSIRGQGVIIQGVSGIGKSEIALELISRGHILVADDRVDLRCVDEEIYGTTVPILHNKLEVRGVGIIDVKELFGATSVITSKKLNFIIEIVDDNIHTFDRIGNNLIYEEILGIKVVKMRLPLRVGRNYATIIETAVAQIKIFETEGNTGDRFIKQLKEQLLEGKND